MISRCPSCGAPAPDEARQCPACDWDFIANKKVGKTPPPPKKTEPPEIKPKTESPAVKPKTSAPPASGLSLPPARGGPEAAPAAGLGMARLPKVEPAAPPTPEENPFALPVARNLGPKPGDGLFSAAPPPAAEPGLPAAKPKDAEPKEADSVEAEEPPKKALSLPKAEPPRMPPPKKIVEAPPPPPPPPAAKKITEALPDEEPAAPAALFLPSSTSEIVVEPEAKLPEPEAVKPAVEPPKARPATTESHPMRRNGRQTPVYFAALAGGALGLLGLGVIYMTIRSEPSAPSASQTTRSSPFGKRSSDDAAIPPALDEPALTPEAHRPETVSPAPMIESDAPAPKTLPAPALSRPAEPPGLVVAPRPPIDTPRAVKTPVAPPPASPPPDSPKTNPPVKANQRPAATFARAVKPKPAAVAAAPRKPAGPRWVFEGTVYDLISTRGVYGVRLVFVDAEDNEVASVSTVEGGRYHAEMRAGPENGYSLRLNHEDYTGKHIDELDSTSSLRKADLEQRKFLMQAGARNLPWIGMTGSPVRRDMALVPKSADEE